MFEAYRIRYCSVFADTTPRSNGEEFAVHPHQEGDETNDPSFICTTWMLYGVHPEKDGVRREDEVAGRTTQEAAYELLTMIIGPHGSPDKQGIYYPQLVENSDIETLYDLTTSLAADLALGHIPEKSIEDSRSRNTLLISWANEFNNQHRGWEWDGDYLDAVDDFYAERTAHLRTTEAPPQPALSSASPLEEVRDFITRHGDDQTQPVWLKELENEAERFLCQNCGKAWKEDELNPIQHVSERVATGETMPAGECPECGAVCHPVTTSRARSTAQE